MKTEAGIGEMHLQAREHHRSPGQILSQTARRSNPADNLIWAFWPLTCKRKKFLLFEASHEVRTGSPRLTPHPLHLCPRWLLNREPRTPDIRKAEFLPWYIPFLGLPAHISTNLVA